MIFNIQFSDGAPFATDAQQLEELERLRFRVIPYKVLAAPEAVQAEIHRLGEERYEYPYEMDGAVVKVNRLSLREQLGSTAKFPRWAAAWKYPPEQKLAKVLDIVVQVGRTVVLTPKVVTERSGCRHNCHQRDPAQPGFYHEKDVRVGDTVLIQRRGRLFPK